MLNSWLVAFAAGACSCVLNFYNFLVLGEVLGTDKNFSFNYFTLIVRNKYMSKDMNIYCS